MLSSTNKTDRWSGVPLFRSKNLRSRVRVYSLFVTDTLCVYDESETLRNMVTDEASVTNEDLPDNPVFYITSPPSLPLSPAFGGMERGTKGERFLTGHKVAVQAGRGTGN
jgi:hypothetical protein